MMRTAILASALLFCLLLRPLQASDELTALQKRVERIAASEKLDAGVGFIHIESGESFFINPHKPYPLASVFKVPVAVCLYRQADGGKISMAAKLKVSEQDKCIGSGPTQYADAGREFSLSHLVHEMLAVSDNTATDMLWNVIGGDACNDLFRQLSLKNSDIYIANRPSYLICLSRGTEFRGKTALEVAGLWKKKTREERWRSIGRVLEENRTLTRAAFQRIEDESASSGYAGDVAVAEALDNLSSPYDFSSFLAELHRGRLLSPSSTEKLLTVMANTKFNSRIPAALPADTKVCHKTGTISGVVNDAGIVEVSPGSHFVLTVFVRAVPEGKSARAGQVISRISKEVYDFCKKYY